MKIYIILHDNTVYETEYITFDKYGNVEFFDKDLDRTCTINTSLIKIISPIF